jgi:hypothetical protein
VGPNGQTGINLAHTALHSPVTGIVTRAGEGKYGTIAIRDANGLSHEILHTHSQHVAVGDPVVAGQIVGTMGNTGASDQHVHYQLKDSARNTLNPIDYWNGQGRIDPDPAPPAYLDDYQRYLGIPGSTTSNISAAPASGREEGSGSALSWARSRQADVVQQQACEKQHAANLDRYQACNNEGHWSFAMSQRGSTSE